VGELILSLRAEPATGAIMKAASIKKEESVDFIDRSIVGYNALIPRTYNAYFLGNTDKSLENNDIWIY
jgi:hypothetical protein